MTQDLKEALFDLHRSQSLRARPNAFFAAYLFNCSWLSFIADKYCQKCNCNI